MAETSELLFKIGADANEAAGALNRFRELLSGSLASLKADFSVWAGAAAAGATAVVGALVAAANKAADYADNIDALADKTGLSAEAASRLSFASRQLGVDQDLLGNSLIFFAAAIDRARSGSTEQVATFERLGISQQDLVHSGGDMERMLLRVSDAFRSSGDATAKARIARELFSRGGAELIDFLNRGSEGIREFTRRAEELGLVLTDHDIVAAKQFTMELQHLNAQWDAMVLQVGQKVLPKLSSFIVLMEAAAIAAKNFITGQTSVWTVGADIGAQFALLWADLEKRIKAAESAAEGAGRTFAAAAEKATPFVFVPAVPERPAPSLLTPAERFERLIRDEEFARMEEYLDDLAEFEQEMQKSAAKAMEGFRRPLTEILSPALSQSLREMMEWEAAAVSAPSAAADAWLKSTNLMRGGLLALNQALGQAIAMAIVYRGSITDAMRQATAAVLASLAAEAFVRAIYATALGFWHLAHFNFKAAGEAFTSAAIFGAVGGAAAVAGRAIAPPRTGGGVSATPVGLVGGLPADGGGSASDRPRGGVTVIIQGHVIGRAGIEEMTDIINEAVRDRDVRLIATSVRRSGQETR
jgi:hypothetical protein